MKGEVAQQKTYTYELIKACLKWELEEAKLFSVKMTGCKSQCWQKIFGRSTLPALISFACSIRYLFEGNVCSYLVVYNLVKGNFYWKRKKKLMFWHFFFNFSHKSCIKIFQKLIVNEKIIVYSQSTINAYFLFSHKWWVSLIKFMVKLTIHVRRESTHLWYFGSA